MERIRHIRETSNKATLELQTEENETPSVREKIVREEYNLISETHPEQIRVREYLNSIDENTLRDIFAEYFRKVGSDEDSMNWIPFDQVRIINVPSQDQSVSKSINGNYSQSLGVTLFAHNLNNESITLWAVIHELIHAVSESPVNHSIIKTGKDTMDLTSIKRSGVRIDSSNLSYKLNQANEVVSKSELKLTRDNINSNEAITELLTERIFNTYLDRTGTRTTQHEIEGLKLKLFGGYEQYWRNMKLYIGLISVLTSVDTETVENAVIRTYLRNGHIVPSELEVVLSSLDHELPKLIQAMINNEDHDSTTLKFEIFKSIYDLPSLSQDHRDALVKMYDVLRREYKVDISRYQNVKENQG